MEDAHTTALKVGTDGKSAFFAVYDGHGGQTAAKFAGAELHDYIVKEEGYAKGDYEAAIVAGYLAADAALRENPEMVNDSSGCTAVSVLIAKDGAAYCGNAGDSRCIISSGGRAVALSHDHKPTDDVEFNRIRDGGGYVEFGRVNGNLALSRAIGDFEFKNNRTLGPEKQIVTALPDVVKHVIGADDEFLVIACDGIWDCMTNQQVVQFVHAKVAEGKKLDQVCEEMMDRCLAGESDLGGVGCDNMTVVIVGLLGSRSEDEWYAHVKQVAEDSGMKSSPKIDRSVGSEAAEDGASIINAILQRGPHFEAAADHSADVGIDAGADVPDIVSPVHEKHATPPPADEQPADAAADETTPAQPSAEASDEKKPPAQSADH
ncbi:Protein phosphatase 2C 2 [Coemansia sp. RSA 2049]|nr:Protein phosphatase 2C 2 [Coemansia sp. RSA 2049]KAJ2521867.1 Protein phosphatase 2C 2 [Coemansia sp. RSA 1939]KAJ2612972.1 Protein phosphatase 2C 2 [Coemansia sp. RSA 1804]